MVDIHVPSTLRNHIGEVVPLVIALHPYPGYDHVGRHVRRLADAARLPPVHFLIHAMAHTWQRSAILSQVRQYAVEHDKLAAEGWHEFHPWWPTIDNATYVPQSWRGVPIGHGNDTLLYRLPLKGDLFGRAPIPMRGRNLDVQALFCWARTVGCILVYCAWDLEILEVIHMYVNDAMNRSQAASSCTG